MSALLPPAGSHPRTHRPDGAVPVCPVCGKRINPAYLLCRAHWYKVTRATRAAVWAALEAWTAGRLSLRDLRAVQAEAVQEARMAR